MCANNWITIDFDFGWFVLEKNPQPPILPDYKIDSLWSHLNSTERLFKINVYAAAYEIIIAFAWHLLHYIRNFLLWTPS